MSHEIQYHYVMPAVTQAAKFIGNSLIPQQQLIGLAILCSLIDVFVTECAP